MLLVRLSTRARWSITVGVSACAFSVENVPADRLMPASVGYCSTPQRAVARPLLMPTFHVPLPLSVTEVIVRL